MEKKYSKPGEIGEGSGSRAMVLDPRRLEEINVFLKDPENPLVREVWELIDRYGGVEEINRRARENGRLDVILSKMEKTASPHLEDIRWLMDQRDKERFISIEEYRKKILGPRADDVEFDEEHPVTLEISACQYFLFFIEEARRSVKKGELMPGRYIRVRGMKEQEADGDLLAMSAAMKIIDASWCETLDTRGTDGSNIHLGGPDTITGYFGGVGQPNHYPILWADELLYYYTNYGVKQVLNVNPGTVLLAYMLHKMGVDIEFKISVYMGNDNPYAVFWTLLAARLFSRDDGTTSLIGFNFANSVDNTTIRKSSIIRHALGLEDNVRFEHHITETWKSIVIQPYNRREELLDIARDVPNISAKHEGGEIEIEEKREHPSDILDYFRPRAEIEAEGLMPALLTNYLDKHEAVNNTAKALTENGLTFIAARSLHHR